MILRPQFVRQTAGTALRHRARSKLRQGWMEFILLALLVLLASNTAAEPAAEQVVLLHGIGKQARDMAPLAKILERAGYKVLNLDYPSTDAPIEPLAIGLLDQVQQHLSPLKTTHFVAHSMGGLIALHLAAVMTDFPIGRMVQLGTPNHGSEVADALQHQRWFKALYGPAGQQLTTEARNQPLPSQRADAFGIIAGNRSIDPISSWLIPGPDDGKVAVARTRHGDMDDHIVLGVAHPFLPRSEQVHDQVLYFLKNKYFYKKFN